MKYDIAKNEDGPLRKTVKREHNDHGAKPSGEAATSSVGNELTAQRYPALHERMGSVEMHVAVRYGKLVLVWYISG